MKTLRILTALAFAVLVLATGALAQSKKRTTKPKATTQKKVVPQAEVETATEILPQPTQPEPTPLVQQQQPVPTENTPVSSQEQTGSTTRRAEQGDGGINPNSARPIEDADIMYRVTNWRRMDLREKLNQPFFSKNNEITRYLIDGVRSGVLKAYTNDSLATELSTESFGKNLMYENTEGGLSEEEKAAGFGAASGDDGWGGDPKKAPAAKKGTGTTAATEDDGWGGTTAKKTDSKGATAQKQNDGFGDEPTAAAGGGPIEYFPQELTILEIKEDFIFDRKRSRAYNDIQSLTIIIPAEKTSRGFDVPVASFRYKDIDKYFRSNPTKFIWYNSMNQAQHKNMADAFDLRLFQARLIKQSNANDAYLTDIHGGEKQGLVKSQQLEYKLMEFEHNLWEY